VDGRDAPGGRPGELAEAVTGALRRHGADVIVIRAAGIRREVLASRARSALAGPSGVVGVVSLLAVQDQALPGYPGVHVGTAATRALLQALGDAGIAAPLWALTRGAVSVGEGDPLVSPAQAQAWGLGRVAALEHPSRWGGLVDLPAELDELAAARLCAILAFAAGRRGAQVAQWLARCGAGHVVLASRRAADAPGAAALAARLAGTGAHVTVTVCDVTDRDVVAALLDQIAAIGPPLTAIVHAAGTERRTALATSGPVEFTAVAGARAAGACHLNELTREMDLDAFVLFSSAAGVWGSGGHSVHAAASAFLDALACQRRARGQTAFSIAWGSVGQHRARDPDNRAATAARDAGDGTGAGGGGAAAAGGGVRRDAADRRRHGLGTIHPGLHLGAAKPCCSATFRRSGTCRTPMRRIPMPRQRTGARAWPAFPCRTGTADAGSCSRRTRRGAGVCIGDSVEADTGVLYMGMSSMSAVELRGRLVERIGLDLPVRSIYELSTPAAMAEFLLAELTPQTHRTQEMSAT
jgi:hypothetical protein